MFDVSVFPREKVPPTVTHSGYSATYWSNASVRARAGLAHGVPLRSLGYLTGKVAPTVAPVALTGDLPRVPSAAASPRTVALTGDLLRVPSAAAPVSATGVQCSRGL